MSIKKYETLLKTIDLGSLTKASEELGYTQSAISHMITGLEDEMGVKIVIRDRAGVRLTEEGRGLIPAIRSVCKANDEVCRQVAELHHLEIGTLKIGTILSAALHILPEMLYDFSERYPKVNFEVLQGSNMDIERWIQEGKVDCGILYEPFPQELERIFLKEEKMVAVFPESRHIKGGRFSLKNLKGEDLIVRPGSLQIQGREPVKRLASKPKIAYTAKDEYAVMAFVERGLGMGIVPEFLLERSHYRVNVCELDPYVGKEIYLTYKEEHGLPPAVRQFIHHVKDSYVK